MGAESSKKERKKIREEKQREISLKEERMRQEEKRRETRYVLRNAGDHNLRLARFAKVQKSLPGCESVFIILHHSNL